MTAGATFCKLPLEVINSYENKSVHLALTLSVSRKLFWRHYYNSNNENAQQFNTSTQFIFSVVAFKCEQKNGERGIIRDESLDGKKWKKEDVIAVVSVEISPTSAKPRSC